MRNLYLRQDLNHHFWLPLQSVPRSNLTKNQRSILSMCLDGECYGVF